jgi:hypothetical protein
MSAAIPYLAAEAATQGDKELPPRCRPVITDSILSEIEYLADLCQTASTAVGDSLLRLAGAGVALDRDASQTVSWDLMKVALVAHIAALRAREGRG